VENPRQVPAYDYPSEHGPRPPCFARATMVSGANGRGDVFISGTSSIRGHASIAPGETAAQVACTLENLREISVACGCGPDLARGRVVERHFKVYLRHAADWAAVKAALEGTLLAPADTVSYLRADVCRRELNVEIEATLMGAAIGG
jgi:enamine deaminase RidA (YjgF/YER057c/UK114 family)